MALRSRRSIALLAAAGVAATTAGVLLLARPGPADFGAPDTATVISSVTSGTPQPIATSPSSLPTPAIDSTGPEAPPASTTTSTGASTAASTAGSPIKPVGVPLQITFPSTGLTAAIDPVLLSGSELEVPDDPQRVGWWLASALPGSAAGTTVLDGHIDSARAGIGVFATLTDLQPADPVEVTLEDGTTVTYRVDARRTYSKVDGLPAELFDRTGPPSLVLITCGGDFDTDALSYDDNVVVLASPS